MTKHVKGNYEKLIFQLLDEDTFSRDDLLGTCEVEFSTLVESPVVGDIDMHDADKKKIGTVNLSVSTSLVMVSLSSHHFAIYVFLKVRLN